MRAPRILLVVLSRVNVLACGRRAMPHSGWVRSHASLSGLPTRCRSIITHRLVSSRKENENSIVFSQSQGSPRKVKRRRR
eukprot:2168429-Pleurochrysis_carterae.AAC.1